MGGRRGYPSEENAPVKGKAHAETDTLIERDELHHGFVQKSEGFVRFVTWQSIVWARAFSRNFLNIFTPSVV